MSPQAENQERIEIVSDTIRFRLHVVETLGGLKADVCTLKTQSTDQYTRISSLEQNGCAQGRTNADNIARVERVAASPNRRAARIGIVGGTGAAAVLVGVLQWLETRPWWPF